MEDEQERPWTWGEAGKVTLLLEAGPKEYRLVPTEPGRVHSFRNALGLARKVTSTLLKAQEAFESGAAEYQDATERLKKLLVEFGKALTEQMKVARDIGTFFEPAGIQVEFAHAVDFLTEFAAESIEKLYEAAAKAKKAPEPPVPPVPPKPDEKKEPAQTAAAKTE